MLSSAYVFAKKRILGSKNIQKNSLYVSPPESPDVLEYNFHQSSHLSLESVMDWMRTNEVKLSPAKAEMLTKEVEVNLF